MGGPGSGRKKKTPEIRDMLKKTIPLRKMLTDDEIEIYEAYVNIYLDDFEESDLTSGDMDDIMSLAMNRVLEFRLLESSKGDADRQVDISASIEKLRKQTEKIKENLSSRRRDRINPNEFKGFSIVDLAVSFDKKKKDEMYSKVKKLKEEEKIVLKSREEYSGNRYDVDSDEKNLMEGLE